MCATFQLCFDDSDDIRELSGAITEKYGDEAAAQCFGRDFFPKSEAPVIGPGKTVSLLKWGFPMKGSKNVVFNARAESLAEKSMFQSSLEKRCLVPATAFYEWNREKTKYRISGGDRGLFYMAGLWKAFVTPAGEKEFRFTIITTAPNGQVERIHSRMPALIPSGDIAVWFGETQDALRLLTPSPALLQISPV